MNYFPRNFDWSIKEARRLRFSPLAALYASGKQLPQRARGGESMKMNCWEFKKCGRQPGGPKAAELGVCPASLDDRLDGIHGGKHAGRACWVLAGTLCGGKPQGTYANKHKNCQLCDFYRAVKDEEGMDFQLSIVLLRKLGTGLVPAGR